MFRRLQRILCGKLALRDAAQRQDLKRVDRLLRLGFDPFQEVWEYGRGFDRPIAVAITTGKVPLVKLMLRHGWKRVGEYDFRRTALSLAVKSNHTEMARFLVGEAAPVSLGDLRLAISQDNVGMVNVLTKNLSDGYFLGSDREYSAWVLLEAAKRDQVTTIKELIRLGLDINSRENGWHVTHAAASGGSVRMLRVLAEIGVPMDDARHGFETPLVMAAKANHVEAARFLLAADANVNGSGIVAPLSGAIEAGNIGMVRLLLQHGADVNVTFGLFSPMGNAIEKHNAEAVRLLIDHGADLTVTFDIYSGDDDSRSWIVDLVEFANHCGAHGIAEMLKAAGAGKPKGT